MHLRILRGMWKLSGVWDINLRCGHERKCAYCYKDTSSENFAAMAFDIKLYVGGIYYLAGSVMGDVYLYQGASFACQTG